MPTDGIFQVKLLKMQKFNFPANRTPLPKEIVVPSAWIYRPSFHENKPKTLVVT
jgi:hypothetical protein